MKIILEGINTKGVRSSMELPQTLEQAILVLKAKEDELQRMREQEKDWINLAREFLSEYGVTKGRKWARTQSRAQSGRR